MKKGTKKWLMVAAVLTLAVAPVVLPMHVVAALSAAAVVLGVPLPGVLPGEDDRKLSSASKELEPPGSVETE